MKMSNNTIDHNMRAHDKVFKSYNLKHSEIYNEFEQERLRALILDLTEKMSSDPLSVLDVGAGTGNLSLKFLQLNCKVTASDVSEKSLELLKKLSSNNQNLDLAMIKDEKLPFEDNSFDIVCTYSVLHHIPDYLHTVKEMIRVAKPGGYIYIDHEANDNKYNPSESLSRYNALTRQTLIEHIFKLIKTKELLSFDFVHGAFIKLLINPRFQREGDIHVYKDDHIEWDKIIELANENKCTIAEEVDYLMYRPKGGRALYDNFKNKCNDTKYVVIQKNSYV